MTDILIDIINEKKSALLIAAESLESIEKQLKDAKDYKILETNIGEELHKIFVRKENPIPACILIPKPLEALDREAFILLAKYAIESSLVILCEQATFPSLHKIKEDLIHNITTSMTTDIMFYNYYLYEQQKDQLQQKLSEKIIVLS